MFPELRDAVRASLQSISRAISSGDVAFALTDLAALRAAFEPLDLADAS